jgi:Protein of unknown function (DUF2924)
MTRVDLDAIEGEIDRIRSLGLEDLRREWRRLNHIEPPRISRDLFVLALGYRLQEIAHGGLGKSTRRKLRTMAKTLRTTRRVGPAPSLSLKPGARLGSTPSGKPAPPSFSRKSARAGRCCRRFMMAGFPAARWSGQP